MRSTTATRPPLWSGDQVSIAGRAVENRSRQTELLDRYLERVRAGNAK
jgi:hypothetical protein